MNSYDAIVLGTGGVGSAALYHLARRGLRVLGIDQFPPAHDRGSSHGETRIIRQAYFEHPDYVPLLLRAYELWAELQRETNQQLLYQKGLLQVGARDGVVIPGVLESARRHGLKVDELSAEDVQHRFLGFRVPDRLAAVFEPQAGYLLVEKCVLAHLELARRHGAEHRTGEVVVSWGPRGDGVNVLTDHGEYQAAKLVIAAGPWAPRVLSSLGVRFEIRQKDVWWFSRVPPHFRAAKCCPTFLYELPEGVFYGFPAIEPHGLKAAEHSGGKTVDEPVDDGGAEGFDRLARFVQTYLSVVDIWTSRHSKCYYTMTPDEHFIVDRHPENPNVVLAAGLSGHGFKFTGVLGQALADLTAEGRTDLPIGFLSLVRPALVSKSR